MTILKRFIDSVNKLGPFEKNAKICVALSGGCDSLFLTLQLAEWSQIMGYKLTAISIDHNINPSYISDLSKIKPILKKNNIQHKIISLDKRDWNSNIQEEARKHRYNAIEEYCKKNKIYHVFLGHTQDDMIENYFIRLTRGTSLNGLGRIQNKKLFKNIILYRPLLDFSKQTIIKHLTENKINWIEDPSNNHPIYTRNKVRKLLKSKDFLELSNQTKFSILSDRIIKVINEIDYINALNDRVINEFFVKNATYYNSGYCEINTANINFLEENLIIRILSQAIESVGIINNPPRLTSLKKIYIRLQEEKNFQATLGNTKLKYTCNSKLLFIYPEKISNSTEKVDSNTTLYQKKFILNSKKAFQISPYILTKRDYRNLKPFERKNAFLVFFENGKKLVPFVPKSYYSELNFGFMPKKSLTSNKF